MILRKEDMTVEIGCSSTVAFPLLSAFTIALNALFNILLPIWALLIHPRLGFTRWYLPQENGGVSSFDTKRMAFLIVSPSCKGI